jgi:Flp pilus assembly protein TadD
LEVAQRSNLTNAAALRALEASLAASRSEGQALLAENRALKERVSQQDLPVQDAPSTSGQVAELTRERDELRKRYDAVLAELLRIRMANHLEGTDALTNQLAVLKAKLEAVEAQAEPYSAEELALLRLGRRGSKAPQGDQGSMPATDLEAAVVMVQGRPSPSSQRDPVPAPTNGGSEVQSGVTNVMELSRNAARQLGAGDLTAAAVTLAKALKAAPRDPVCLRLKGRLALLEERDSEALDCLSLSAQIDSQDAETFRLLGLALSRRGLPQPAEAALRRALRLAPQYGVAHHDLAVVYLAQTPPAVDLARWHYRKALEAGEATDPDLEKLMDAPSAGGGAP